MLLFNEYINLGGDFLTYEFNDRILSIFPLEVETGRNWILHFLRVLRLGKFEHDCFLKKLYLEARPTGTLNLKLYEKAKNKIIKPFFF